MLHCKILVAIGANLPGRRTPRETCDWAVGRLAALPGLQLMARSRWYRSAPVPPSGQPDYVNGAVCLAGCVTPQAMLAALHAIEAEAGRVRPRINAEVNAARTLDLDLLAVDDQVIAGPGLTLPHPRMHLRAFVLAPLAEVAAGWEHPRWGGVAGLLARSERAGLSLLADEASLAIPPG